MKYKNMVFDFGNVIGSFHEKTILSAFCPEEDIPVFSKAVMKNWQLLDEGNISYEEYMRQTLALLPESLHENAQHFFSEWYTTLVPLEQTWDFIAELKKQGYRIYLLSNAPVYFADHAHYFKILDEFDGIVFSGPVNMWKPNRDIYQHLFEKYQLNPKECFFIDDKEENVAAAKDCGMDGIVFTGDIAPVRSAIN